ncbi:hypothetical protein Bpfe_020522 [Biomphalaria pfeifferi]|uniref:Uncharacterized protein n=1 Tax=Biomphalaria pfeifferi TaxID=112525 RepID=A0AAD8F4F6_BIOPF|nr:hypothetical protein Bpfe_020522 [Biomphalaria pfeifferi]
MESGAEKIIWSLEQRSSYGVWSREDHMESGAEMIIWSLEQRRLYGVWSREDDHMESGAEKITWSLNQRRSYRVWSREVSKIVKALKYPSLLEGQNIFPVIESKGIWETY